MRKPAFYEAGFFLLFFCKKLTKYVKLGYILKPRHRFCSLKKTKLLFHMKKSTIFKILALLLITLPMMSVNKTVVSGDSEIRWRKGLRLEWRDFKGRAERLSPMDALTESGISFSWSCDSRGFDTEIYALFVPHGSWVKDPTPTLLKHEQAHFDITEIHARKLRKFFAEHPNPCRLGRSGIDKASKKIIKESYDLQNTYDESTNHGENRRMQKEWLVKIDNMLDALSDYAE